MLVEKHIELKNDAAKCPECRNDSRRHKEGSRTLNDLGSRNKPRKTHVSFSIHRCKRCDIYFANPRTSRYFCGKNRYSKRFMAFAVEKLRRADQLKKVKRVTPMKHTERTDKDHELMMQSRLEHVANEILKQTGFVVPISTLARWKKDYIESSPVQK